MVEEYIQREAPDIEARKLGLMDAAKALTEKGYDIPEYILADLTQDQNFDWVYWQEGIFRSEENFELVIYGCPIDISKNLVYDPKKKSDILVNLDRSPMVE